MTIITMAITAATTVSEQLSFLAMVPFQRGHDGKCAAGARAQQCQEQHDPVQPVQTGDAGGRQGRQDGQRLGIDLRIAGNYHQAQDLQHQNIQGVFRFYVVAGDARIQPLRAGVPLLSSWIFVSSILFRFFGNYKQSAVVGNVVAGGKREQLVAVLS